MTDSSSVPMYVYGAGGHGLVVAEAAEAAGMSVLGFLDESPPAAIVGKWSVRQMLDPDANPQGVIVAIGDNMARRRMAADIVQTGLKLVSVIHPTAWVSPSAIIGQGVYIGPTAVVNGQAHVENGAIINTGAVVEHHCVIGSFAHVGPRAVLAGDARLGDLATLGAGASVKPGTRIGEDCRIGIGAAVVADIPNGQTVAGVPAKPLE